MLCAIFEIYTVRGKKLYNYRTVLYKCFNFVFSVGEEEKLLRVVLHIVYITSYNFSRKKSGQETRPSSVGHNAINSAQLHSTAPGMNASIAIILRLSGEYARLLLRAVN